MKLVNGSHATYVILYTEGAECWHILTYVGTIWL